VYGAATDATTAATATDATIQPILIADIVRTASGQVMPFGLNNAGKAMSNERENTDAMKEAGKAAAQWVKEFTDRASRSPTPVEAWFSALGCQAARQSAGATGRVIGHIKIDICNHPFAVLETAYDEHGRGWADGATIYAAPIGVIWPEPGDADTVSFDAQPAKSGTEAVFAQARKAVEKDMAGFRERLLEMAQPAESKRVELTPTDIRAIANSYDLDNAPLIVEFSRALLARSSAKDSK